LPSFDRRWQDGGVVEGGMVDAGRPVMPIRHYRELITWQLADALETEVLRVVGESEATLKDLRYRSQIEDAVSGVPANVAEGFMRRSAGDFCRFLDYALASLVEAELRLHGGIKRGYFAAVRCQNAFVLARRTLTAAVRLKQSQLRHLEHIRASKQGAADTPGRKKPRRITP
jgi:four helix bundle protein